MLRTDSGRMRAVHLVAALSTLSVATVAAAEEVIEDRMGTGRLSLTFPAVRFNVGELRDSYDQMAIIWGGEASYILSRVPLGAMWGIQWGRMFTGNESLVENPLSFVEMSFGLVSGWSITDDDARSVFITGGAALLRTDAPPFGVDRQFFGGYIGAGIEELFFERLWLSFETRYGLIGGDLPAGITAIFKIGAGS